MSHEICLGGEFSIHSPLAGRDRLADKPPQREESFSIHSPLAGRDGGNHETYVTFNFSIHSPLAGRDNLRMGAAIHRIVFNPLAPCGARPVYDDPKVLAKSIFSIHSPLAGRDPIVTATATVQDMFSIHSPLAGRDLWTPMGISADDPFSIHSPLAGRDMDLKEIRKTKKIFQSTRPLRGETKSH